MQTIAIIGGGITGLAAAYYTQKSLLASGRQREIKVNLYERASYWGGKIKTTRQDGFVVEAGPDTFLATKPSAVQLCRELGLGKRLRGTNPNQRNTYILKNKRLHTLPGGLTMMIPTEIGPMLATGLLSWPDKLRMGLDFLIPPAPRNGDETLGHFVSRRIGRSAYENLVEPLMSGIYAGDGDRLSLQSTFPYLRDLELTHGGLVKGALAVRHKRSIDAKPSSGRPVPGSRSMFLTPLSGLAEIVEALVENLLDQGVGLHANTHIHALLTDGDGYQLIQDDGRSTRADAVILASPAFASSGLLKGLDPVLAGELSAIDYASTATVSLAYRRADISHPLDGYGYVIPRRSGHTALACTWTSTKFPHRAPDGTVLLRVFIGRAGQEAEVPWEDEALALIARAELKQTMRITSEPLHTWVQRWEQAMPQYNLGHPERLERIGYSMDNHPRLALAGAGYRGIGIPDCITSAQEAVEKILSTLTISHRDAVLVAASGVA